MESGTSLSDQSADPQSVQVRRCDRWQIYQRLQDLDIDCICPVDGGLKVVIASPTALVQFWSVIQPYQASRPMLVNYLDRCWQRTSNSHG